MCFSCSFYWRLHPQLVEPEQNPIKFTWPDIPKKVDAAYENPERDVVFIFSGLCVFTCTEHRQQIIASY